MSEKRPYPETTFLEQPYFKTPVPAKARSKWTRTGGRTVADDGSYGSKGSSGQGNLDGQTHHYSYAM
ncbi:hypothetical protein COP1_008940 [Malus domestica]